MYCFLICNVMSHQSTGLFPKSLEDHQDVFVTLLSLKIQPWNSIKDVIFLFLLNTDFE